MRTEIEQRQYGGAITARQAKYVRSELRLTQELEPSDRPFVLAFWDVTADGEAMRRERVIRFNRDELVALRDVIGEALGGKDGGTGA